MSMSSGELMVLLILFLIAVGVIRVIVVVVNKLLQRPHTRNVVTKTMIEIDQDAHAELKMIAARDGVTIQKIIGDLLHEYIKTHR